VERLTSLDPLDALLKQRLVADLRLEELAPVHVELLIAIAHRARQHQVAHVVAYVVAGLGRGVVDVTEPLTYDQLDAAVGALRAKEIPDRIHAGGPLVPDRLDGACHAVLRGRNRRRSHRTILRRRDSAQEC
jgi:hypothetical protein